MPTPSPPLTCYPGQTRRPEREVCMSRTLSVHRPTRVFSQAVVGVVAAALLASGCSAPGSDTVAGRAQGNGQYVSGDGTVEQVADTLRGEPVELTGTTLAGKPWNSAEARGSIVVLNTWGSWCPPCVSEIPELQKVWVQAQEKKQPVVIMGINLRESPQTAKAFLDAKGVTYPSLADDGGAAQLALQGKATATPTTLILDRQGRIAARVSGGTTASTLGALVDDVVAERD